MTVSTIVIGAGSRALSTRPILPTADSISGMAWNAMSCIASCSAASPIEACGIVIGIYRNEPSSKSGMNSLPSPGSARARPRPKGDWRNPSGAQANTLPNPSQTQAPKSRKPAGTHRNAAL
ncbi:MAG: hypothetical protein BWZ10_02782 [candidate division BRC1 bacterium ADurb.BinA364]|nr:MAG: hypothetical protein BWZ10_02782 [candidate division BRC1 bacterium ADurb.BinA364]